MVGKVEMLLDAFRVKGWKLVTAESCTGGMVAMMLTEVAGSSDVFERGFVTYSNLAKTQCLEVDAALLEGPGVPGAVSGETARAMALGAIAHSAADVAVAITGVAGPGQSENKQAGLVYIGFAVKDGEDWAEKHQFSGDRAEVRKQSAARALEGLAEIASA